MLHKPNVNVSNVMKVIDSIKADDEFNMNNWSTCICGHCHRVMGHGSYRNDDWRAAYEFLGIDEDKSREINLFSNGDYRDKDWAIQTLQDLIAFDAVPSSVE